MAAAVAAWLQRSVGGGDSAALAAAAAAAACQRPLQTILHEAMTHVKSIPHMYNRFYFT